MTTLPRRSTSSKRTASALPALLWECFDRLCPHPSSVLRSPFCIPMRLCSHTLRALGSRLCFTPEGEGSGVIAFTSQTAHRSGSRGCTGLPAIPSLSCQYLWKYQNLKGRDNRHSPRNWWNYRGRGGSFRLSFPRPRHGNYYVCISALGIWIFAGSIELHLIWFASGSWTSILW